jgi:hypothetical protein
VRSVTDGLRYKEARRYKKARAGGAGLFFFVIGATPVAGASSSQNRCENSTYNPPESRIAIGSVNTQAISMLRMVAT